MANEKMKRDRYAEKAVKERLKKTHLRSFRIVGSQHYENTGIIKVYMLRTVGNSNYLFRINVIDNGRGGYDMSGLIPLTERNEYGEYIGYNPQPANAEALKPTEREKRKFKGYE